MALRLTPPIRALLIDISGTLLIGPSSTPGAAQALSSLRAAHIPFRLCSNTSKESTRAVHERMRTAGLDVRLDELWTSVGALRVVLHTLGVRRPFMLLSNSALEELQECTTGSDSDHRVVPGDDAPESASSSMSSPYDAVVVGLAPSLLDYAHLNTAFRILIGEHRPPAADSPQPQPQPQSWAAALPPHRPPPPLIALHKARYLEAPDHALSLGPGPFVTALEDAAQTSATVVGKPTRAFFEAVLRDLERDLDQVPRGVEGEGEDEDEDDREHTAAHRWEGIAMIGDDVLADLGHGAVELGLWRVLVKTGKYRPGDESRQGVLPPDQVCTSFAAFVETLVEQRARLTYSE